MLKIKGHNDFYDGWLACVFCLPMVDDKGKSDNWKRGYKMASNLKSHVRSSLEGTLKNLIELGDIIVEEEE